MPCVEVAFANHLRERDDRGDRINALAQRLPIFRGLEVRSTPDWWNYFFYRFVAPEERKRLPNYRDRMRNAAATTIRGTSWAVFRSPAPRI
jgi:hypothetical protein